ncbi:hypothetical protein RclHR1_00110020 [Rhizophagus clarus]|uniref:Transmembrane protein n=1 Tax=Rhizophagus clarus TaxID=94130 RepID=A0A2Z6Q3F0_9GLOM|nr:hypothetical protein RclHR1_00110020 [Rhizophagus clarus]GES98000.1 hypothetical protein GLOIN_2v1689810 [Rhizophagus clarus]
MGLQIAKCCCCIPLKAGVIIISLLWLLGGLFYTVFGAASIKLSEQDIKIYGQEPQFSSTQYSTVVTFAIIMVVVYAFIALGAAFGLYAAIFSKKYKMLKIYSTIGYIIAGIQVLFSIASIIRTIISKSICENYPAEGLYINCNQLYTFYLPFYIIFGIFIILLSVYFSLVISAYARRRKAKEETVTYLNGSSGQTNHNLVLDLSGQTNHNLVH